jgi:hypothetical protein
MSVNLAKKHLYIRDYSKEYTKFLNIFVFFLCKRSFSIQNFTSIHYKLLNNMLHKINVHMKEKPTLINMKVYKR